GVVLVIVFGTQLVSPDDNFATSFANVGHALSDALGADNVDLFSGITFVLVFGWWLTFLPLNTVAQTQIQRIYAAKSEAVMRRVSLMMIVFTALFMTFSLSLIGLLGRSLLPDLSNPEAVFPSLAL